MVIEQESADLINQGLLNKRRICAVGTTVMRAIESSVSSMGTLNEFDGWTNKFIFPPSQKVLQDSDLTTNSQP